MVNQINEEYQVENSQMEKYLCKVRELLAWFKIYTIERVPRSKNSNADALAKLASSYQTKLPKSVLVEILNPPSIFELEVRNVEVKDPT